MGSYLDELKEQMAEKTIKKEEQQVKEEQQPKEIKLDSLKHMFDSKKNTNEQSAKPISEMIAKIENIKNIDFVLANWEQNGKLVIKYEGAEIYRIEREPLLYYKANISKSSPSQKMIINTLKEATTRLITTDPYKIRDPIQRQNIYYQKILEILENAPEINVPKHMFAFYAKAVVTEMVGFGLIDPLIHDHKLEEIMIIGPNKPTYVYHRDYGMMYTNIVFYSETEIEELIDKIARILGRRVDISSTLLDARLPDG